MSTDLVVQEQKSAPQPLVPLFKAKQLMEMRSGLAEIIKGALKEKNHYGTIPGTDRPSLWKPGAEAICKAYGCHPVFEVISSEVDHDKEIPWKKSGKGWSKEGTSFGLYRYVIKCKIFNFEDRLIAEGIGSCSTLEAKYIEKPRDMENTVIKMAKKRAFVDATLTAFSLSDQFTQDTEDMAPVEVEYKETKPKRNVQQASELPQRWDYTGTKEQDEKIIAWLRSKNVSPDLDALVAEAMVGKTNYDLPKVLEEVQAKALTKDIF